MLGLPIGEVRLSDYMPSWSDLFELEKNELYSLIGQYISDVYHFGSTSVEGLVAKPIIDIAVTVDDLEHVSACRPYLESNGYAYHGEYIRKDCFFFSKGSPTTHHLHFTLHDGDIVKDWLLFRNRLREDKKLLERYARLKKSLEKKYSNDRTAYSGGKSVFINDVVDDVAPNLQ